MGLGLCYRGCFSLRRASGWQLCCLLFKTITLALTQLHIRRHKCGLRFKWVTITLLIRVGRTSPFIPPSPGLPSPVRQPQLKSAPGHPRSCGLCRCPSLPKENAPGSPNPNALYSSKAEFLIKSLLDVRDRDGGWLTEKVLGLGLSPWLRKERYFPFFLNCHLEFPQCLCIQNIRDFFVLWK